jgi:hypothetical protein
MSMKPLTLRERLLDQWDVAWAVFAFIVLLGGAHLIDLAMRRYKKPSWLKGSAQGR